jgi:biotin carboxyl carrier protein
MARFVVTTEIDGRTSTVDVTTETASDDTGAAVELVPSSEPGIWHWRDGEQLVPVHIQTDGLQTVTLSIRGYSYTARVLRERHAALLEILKASPAQQQRVTRLSAPMPGLLKHIITKEGATVRKGETLFILEAMKMENAIKAPTDGTVCNLTPNEGAAVEKGALLCTIE